MRHACENGYRMKFQSFNPRRSLATGAFIPLLLAVICSGWRSHCSSPFLVCDSHFFPPPPGRVFCTRRYFPHAHTISLTRGLSGNGNSSYIVDIDSIAPHTPPPPLPFAIHRNAHDSDSDVFVSHFTHTLSAHLLLLLLWSRLRKPPCAVCTRTGARRVLGGAFVWVGVCVCALPIELRSHRTMITLTVLSSDCDWWFSPLPLARARKIYYLILLRLFYIPRFILLLLFIAFISASEFLRLIFSAFKCRCLRVAASKHIKSSKSYLYFQPYQPVSTYSHCRAAPMQTQTIPHRPSANVDYGWTCAASANVYGISSSMLLQLQKYFSNLLFSFHRKQMAENRKLLREKQLLLGHPAFDNIKWWFCGNDNN